VKKPSEEAKKRYAEYVKDYKLAIDAALAKEKNLKAVVDSGVGGANYQRLAMADDNLNIVSNYILMNSLSVSFLGVKNENFLNEARKCLYKTIIYLEEVLTTFIDVPFSDYEEGLSTVDAFSDESRYNLVRKLGFSIDSIRDGFGENTKWKWSFVELDGRFAALAKNFLNLKTFLAKMDPREEGYSARMAHLSLTKELLQQAADKYREKYELSTQRLDDMKLAVNYLSALRRLNIILGETEQAEVVKKKIEIWKAKMEADLKKIDAASRR
jgi:hypothetical protein